MLNICCTCKVYWNVPSYKRWQFVEANYCDNANIRHTSILPDKLVKSLIYRQLSLVPRLARIRQQNLNQIDDRISTRHGDGGLATNTNNGYEHEEIGGEIVHVVDD
jgi:hypothetical protein